MGSQLVERSVSSDTRGFFRYPRTTDETGFPSVTRTGIEPRKILASGRPGNRSKGELRP